MQTLCVWAPLQEALVTARHRLPCCGSLRLCGGPNFGPNIVALTPDVRGERGDYGLAAPSVAAELARARVPGKGRPARDGGGRCDGSSVGLAVVTCQLAIDITDLPASSAVLDMALHGCTARGGCRAGCPCLEGIGGSAVG